MSKIPPKPFVMIDGSSYLFRAFHALPPLTNSKGEPTGAVYGVINMIRKLLKDYEPEHVAVVFDAPGKTFRDEIYPEYKSHRPPTPDDLIVQIKPLYEIIQAMGLPLIIVEGVEADDVLGHLARAAEKQGMHTLISTGDKDLAQLVNDHITLINTMTNKILDPVGVQEKFGVRPDQIIDYLSLIGDSSDNIPGVPKVGPKTAAKWLHEYGSLDNIVKHADEIKGKIGENLRNSISLLSLSKDLVTIRYDIDIELNPQDLTPDKPNREQLIKLFKQLEFKSWLSEMLGEPSQLNDLNKAYEVILDMKDFEKWFAKLSKCDTFAFDTETDSLDYINANVVGISFAIEPSHAAYLPFSHDYDGAPTQLNREEVFKKLKPLLENNQPKKIGQNCKFDKSVLANHGIELNGIAYDTMLESYVLDSTANRHDMDTLALKYLGHRTITFEDVAGKGIKQLTFNQIELDKAGPYAAEDADVTLRLHQTLWPKLATEPKLKYIFDEVEMPLVSVLSRIERNGVLIDSVQLKKQSSEIAIRLHELEEEVYTLAGEEFNLGSPKQLQEILFTKLNHPIISKTPTGQASTGEDVLQELALEFPIPKLILEYRSLSKLKSTYTDKLPLQINPKTGRVHTSYNQAVAATGRLSSTDPNLQNIPIRTEEGRRIRQAFIASPGYQLVAADYSQIELRIMAHLSQDQSLITAFEKGWDVHRATAAEVFGVSQENVTNNQRRSAKAINFGLIYGMSAFGLSKQLGIDRHAAQSYVDLYFSRYPGVKRYMDETREQAHKLGYVETLYGRRLYLPEINSRNLQRQRAAERTAINAPMQGTAADIIKLAMIKVDEWLSLSQIDARLIMQVHDELVLEVSENCIDEVRQNLIGYMTSNSALSVSLEVEVGVGVNWDEAH